MTSRTPTDPMTDVRPPRTARLLTAWTLLLLGLVMVEIRHLPPVLAALLVPYLVLMSWYWIGGLRRRATIGQSEPHEQTVPLSRAGLATGWNEK